MRPTIFTLLLTLALTSRPLSAQEVEVYEFVADPIVISAPQSRVDPGLFRAPTGADSPEERLQAGFDAFAAGDYTLALARFREVDRDHPFYPNALYGKALCLDYLGRPEEALYEYNRLILFSSQLPEGDEGRLWRPVALESLVRLLYFNPPDDPLEYLQRILDALNYKDALFILGGVYREYGDYAGALGVYDNLYAHAPDVRTNARLLFAMAETNELAATLSDDPGTVINEAMDLYRQVVERGEELLGESPEDEEVAYCVVRSLGRLGLHHQELAERYNYGGASYLPEVDREAELELLIEETAASATDRSYIYSRNRITRFLDNYIGVIAYIYSVHVPVRDPNHRVEVQITIEPDGAVSDVQLLSSNTPEYFTDRLLDLIAAWRFPPGRRRVVAVYPN
ncbi:MAG: tetratricopeptide repeat protein [bacterium]|nr:tetratricopeptide repeat protein [bacterium]